MKEHIDEDYLLEDSIDLPSNKTILETVELLVVTEVKGKEWIIDFGESKRFLENYSIFKECKQITEHINNINRWKKSYNC